MNLNYKRILIIKPSSMGDVIHALPVAHAIKRTFPNVRIGWVIQSGLESFLENDCSVDEIIKISIPSTSDPHAKRGAYLKAGRATITEWKRLRRQFTSSKYDVSLDLHASFRSGLISLANHGALRLGLADAKELNTYFQHELIPPDPGKPHAVDKNLVFLSRFSIEPIKEDFLLRLSDQVRQNIQVYLDSLRLPAGKRIIYANPAARWRTKRWNIKGWRELTEMILNQMRAIVIFGGGINDRSYIDKIIGEKKFPDVFNVAGRLTPVESAALIEKSHVYVGVDSGPMHIAAFVGVPVVALFGPTDPAKVGPYSEHSVVIKNRALDCLGCRKKSCDNQRCMDEITPEQVLEALLELLG